MISRNPNGCSGSVGLYTIPSGVALRCRFLVPDELEGSLSSILPSQAIALANKEVEKVISEKGDTKKRGATRDGVSIRCVVGLPLTEQNFSKKWIPSAFVHVVTTNTRFPSKFFHPARAR